MPLGECGHVARACIELAPVVHEDMQPSPDVVLEVGSLAQVGPGERLDVIRPAPSRFEDEPSDLAVPDVQQLEPSVFERPNLVGRLKGLLLGLGHGWILLFGVVARR